MLMSVRKLWYLQLNRIKDGKIIKDLIKDLFKKIQRNLFKKRMAS